LLADIEMVNAGRAGVALTRWKSSRSVAIAASMMANQIIADRLD
jgi:hypothetical protein